MNNTINEIDIKNLECSSVIHYFKEINNIPRGSGNEAAVSQYLFDFAKARGLLAYRDAANNVFIKKAGTAGRENIAPVLIQGHMDMVCEKREDVVHDFERDPIKVICENGFMHADGTTLGADDGIAVAMGLALLDSDNIPHPPIEVLFTTDEEVGMVGAAAFDAKQVTSRRMINIDSEQEGVFTVGCAGGVKTHSHIPVKFEKAVGKAYKISVSGLCGGHSGIEIHKERGNANKLIFRLFTILRENIGDLSLAFVKGGAKDNAIPRYAEMTVTTAEPFEELEALVKAAEQTFLNELDGKDRLFITIEPAAADIVFDKESTKRLTAFAALVPNGVQSNYLKLGMPESSNNLGVVKTEGDSVEFICALRSGTASIKGMLLNAVKQLTELCGGTLDKVGDYPAWEFRSDSPLCRLFETEFKKIYGREPIVESVHAGLECGLIGEKLPDMDMISIGPDLHDIHTPEERADIMSIERVWKFLLHILDKMD